MDGKRRPSPIYPPPNASPGVAGFPASLACPSLSLSLSPYLPFTGPVPENEIEIVKCLIRSSLPAVVHCREVIFGGW
ncbi:hypothetical protein RHMOL_Rhmol08G0112700 [Rhododendron molle]|uniref:Uncharacterized protein n=1 Tax=Rhododendron molle TaxID=49168 RepID=A0ACC0MMH7_RHOML|nr:hypothetical protein RHMOL_Rhmol08G0112700 [Rhododendron molle]